MSLAPGARLGPYEILSPIGRGGMGEVHRARHVKLGRDVAIKVLPTELASDRERLRRFEREARAASSLNHPNIVTIHDIAEHEGTTYIAMELVEGRTLRELLSDGPLPVSKTVALTTQIADGLAKAHAAGIVHRDLKPDNVMVTSEGLVKILDFGLAKPVAAGVVDDSSLTTLTKATGMGVLVGTPHYMSPEQAKGDPVDHRSDQFSFGVVLYELLGGKRPFEGPSVVSIITSILHDPLPPLKKLRPDTPALLDKLVRRCLEKNPEKRYQSTAELGRELRRCDESLARAARSPAAFLRRPAVAAALALFFVVLCAAAWFWVRGSGKRWAEHEAPRQIAELIEAGDLYEAYRLALAAKKHIPDDPELEEMLGRITLPLSVVTEPAGAEVSVKGYSTPDASWELLGTTPIEMRVPYALMRWRINKEGFEEFEGAPFGAGALQALGTGLKLDPVDTRPLGTVRIPAGAFRAHNRLSVPGGLPTIPIGHYWLDRYEVTNRQFKEFVDAGGYRSREFWIESFLRDGQELSWDQATASFRDATGRPGPATWKLGTFPEGGEDLPVGGVSWYEASAYCRYANKSLPTVYHWFQAIAQDQLSDILRFSNFGTEGPAPVGSYKGLGGYGTYDMAGNVKEWCWNATEDRRYILGGAWNDPPYMFKQLVAQRPIDRSPTHGVRCVSYSNAPDQVLLDPVNPSREYPKRTPVSEEVFEAYRGAYAYDRSDLEPKVEEVDDASPYWRKETISFNTAYGNERMRAFLFLPRNATPPYQTVVWFPGDDVFFLRSSRTLASSYLFDFIPRSGRALIYPVYQGMYERSLPFPRTPNERRDRMIQWSKDLGRTVDYLETRNDIANDSLAYYGFSSGGWFGPIFTAIDSRFKASVLLAAGVPALNVRPEMDLVHFAPRSRTPTLMINGRDDFVLPYEYSQQPLYDLLGAAKPDKRHARLEGGHIPSNRLEIIREILDWLDRYLGAVGTVPTISE